MIFGTMIKKEKNIRNPINILRIRLDPLYANQLI
jgi:hypothetical protein